MSGLRFESMADMPPRMRELYARQQLPGAAAAPKKASKYHSITARPPNAASCASTVKRKPGGMTS